MTPDEILALAQTIARLQQTVNYLERENTQLRAQLNQEGES